MQVIGFDPGNSEATLAWRSGAALRHVTIPSFIGSGRIEEVRRVRSGAGDGVIQKHEIVLCHQGMSYFVGQLAIDEARHATAARNDVSRYWSGHTLRLLLALAAQANISGSVRIMTGLPVSVWSVESKQQVKRSLIGEHHYAVNGKERALVVESVGVMMEGAAVLASYNLVNTTQAVIDIGGRTTDLFWAEGVKPVARFCSAEEYGVEQAGDILKDGTQEIHRRILSPAEVRGTLRALVTNDSPPRVFNGPQELDLRDAARSAINTVSDQIVSYVSREWGDDLGMVARSAGRVLLIGGGAYYFQDALKRTIPHIEVARTPETANASGYLAIGAAASEEAWARNRG